MRTQIGFIGLLNGGEISEPEDAYVGSEVAVSSAGGLTHGILKSTCNGTLVISNYLIISNDKIRRAEGPGAVAIVSSPREINVLPKGTLDLIINGYRKKEEIFGDGGGI